MTALGAYAAASGRREADALVKRHAELVKRIAYHLAGRLPPSVEVDDLIQAGMLGLLEAAGHFSAGRGASFETYAGIRIRGAMIDALRKLDWAPRSVHRKARDAAQALREVERESGREARDSEVAARLGVSMDDYQSGHVAAAGANGAERMSDVEARMERNTFHRDLVGILENLSDREKKGVLLFYGLTDGKEMSYADLGRRLHISREGARQLIRRSLNKIRQSPKVELLKEYI